MTNSNKFLCHVCRHSQVDNANATYNLLSVSSDCKPIRQEFKVGLCFNCGCIVGSTDEKWQLNVQKIYENYEIYDLSGGSEKVVFNHVNGDHKSRSDLLVGKLVQLRDRKKDADILDIGTGSGVFLQSIQKRFNNSSLYAQDLNDISFAKLRNIPGFKHLFVCDLSDLDQKFDIISMVHVLEHVHHPIDFLRTVRSLLRDDGILIINVPDIVQNSLDLAVYDHCTHFTKASLEWVVKEAGFRLQFSSDRLIFKENVIMATPEWSSERSYAEPNLDNHMLENHMAFLKKISNVASSQVFGNKIHVFGTASASVWVTNYIDEWDGCFIDEDPNRQGKMLLGHKIVSPANIQEQHIVFVPFAEEQSENIKKRLSSATVTYVSIDKY